MGKIDSVVLVIVLNGGQRDFHAFPDMISANLFAEKICKRGETCFVVHGVTMYPRETGIPEEAPAPVPILVEERPPSENVPLPV